MLGTNRLKEELFLREELVKFWLADVGQKETDGKNRGKIMDEINTTLVVPLGSSYCLGGLVVRGLVPLCKKHNLKNPIKRFSSVIQFWEYVNEHGADYVHHKGANALMGDICLMQSIKEPTKGHAYGITQNETVSQKTVEYNTSPAGSRDGDGVWCLIRTQDGTPSKTYLGAVDVVSWILAFNPDFSL